jgi:hypothetical protein
MCLSEKRPSGVLLEVEKMFREFTSGFRTSTRNGERVLMAVAVELRQGKGLINFEKSLGAFLIIKMSGEGRVERFFPKVHG